MQTDRLQPRREQIFIRRNNRDDVTARNFNRLIKVALEKRASYWDPLVDLCGRKPERFARELTAWRIIRLREVRARKV